MATSEADCLDALREARERLGESPTKQQYEDLGLTPAASTILRVVGGWNEAKEKAGLETYEQGENGGQSIEPKPDCVELPEDKEWETLSGQQRWYYKNRDWRQEVKNQRKARLRRWLYEYKRDECECTQCGESHPACLDFHHVGEKTMDISRMVNHGFSRESIREEMDSCVTICANCHRKEHYEIPDTEHGKWKSMTNSVNGNN
jgi:hypothetical protein